MAAKFTKNLHAGLKEPGYDFAEVVGKGKEEAREVFLEGATGALGLSLRMEAVLRIADAVRGQNRRNRLGL